jgi:hypothetical protein
VQQVRERPCAQKRVLLEEEPSLHKRVSFGKEKPLLEKRVSIEEEDRIIESVCWFARKTLYGFFGFLLSYVGKK